MPNHNRRNAQERSVEEYRSVLERRLNSISAELDRIDSIPIDDFDDLTVIRFKLRFLSPSTGQPKSPFYNYAILKVNDLWHVSGAKQPAMNWPSVWDWWTRNEVKKVRVATEWSKLKAPLSETASSGRMFAGPIRLDRGHLSDEDVAAVERDSEGRRS